MRSLLLDEHPLLVFPTFAAKVGLNEAILCQQIHFWLTHNRQNGKNIIDGRVWTYNTQKEWQKQFPFWGLRTLRRVIKSCVDKGLLIAEHKATDKRDRTLYYTLNYDHINNLADATAYEENLRLEQASLATGQSGHMGEQAPSGQSGHLQAPHHGRMADGQDGRLQASRPGHMNIEEQRLPPETSTETSTESSSTESPSNTATPPAAETAAGQEERRPLKPAAFYHNAIRNALRNSLADMVREVPRREHAWFGLTAEQLEVAFRGAQRAAATEGTGKSFSTLLKEHLDFAAGLTRALVPVSAPGGRPSPDSAAESRITRAAHEAATSAYEQAWDHAILTLELPVDEAHDLATAAQRRAYDATYTQLQEQHKRDLAELHQQRQARLREQASLLVRPDGVEGETEA